MGIRNKISPGYAYYLTLTVVEWVDIFSRTVYKHLMVDSLNYCIANKGLKVYCWCLMSNHLHLIAGAADEESLSSNQKSKRILTQQTVHCILTQTYYADTMAKPKEQNFPTTR